MDQVTQNSLSSTSRQTEPFQVYIRLRPNSSLEESPTFLRNKSNSLYVQLNTHERKQRKYDFHRVFPEHQHNSEIYDSVKEQLTECMNGYNLTILAYGVTGSGKTHTIFGNVSDEGLAVRCCRRIFQSEPTQVLFSYMEIYNENVRDLLSEGCRSLNVLEDGNKTMVPDLGEFQVKSESEVVDMIEQGNARRVQGVTNINEVSSRSHAILQFTIIVKKQKQVMQAKLTVIDLAGSERVFHNETDRMMLEGSNINKSLLALGNCITALADKKGPHVPFRDSKLTRILKEGLSGNSRSVMIACLSSNPNQFQETLSTIYYASRATKIRKQLTKNIKDHGVDCPNCHHTFELPSSRVRYHNISRQSKQAIEEITNVNFSQLRQKMNSLIEQSMLIGKRNSCSQQNLYDLSILKQVFESNRGAVFNQIDRLSIIQKSFVNKVFPDLPSNASRAKSSSCRPSESEQTSRRDINQTIDDIAGFKESNLSHLMNVNTKGETSRRATFEPLIRNNRNRINRNNGQLLSRRTSRQHSNLSDLSEVDNTHTLRMKRDSIEEGASPSSSTNNELQIELDIPSTNHYRSARLSLKPPDRQSKKLRLL